MVENFKLLFTPWLKARSGNVTVELALVSGIFALMAMGGFDFSRMAIEKQRLEQVARSATQFGLLSQGNSSDFATIESIAISAAGDIGPDITVDIRTFCQCPGQIETVCSEPCNGGSDGQPYLEVIVTKPFLFLFSAFSATGVYSVSGKAVLPVP